MIIQNLINAPATLHGGVLFHFDGSQTIPCDFSRLTTKTVTLDFFRTFSYNRHGIS